MSDAEHPKAAGEAKPGADPSMEDILASIRRILAEEEAPASAQAAAPPVVPAASQGSDVLQLDASMLVPEITAVMPSPTPIPAPEPTASVDMPAHAAPLPDALPGLIAPEAAAAAATSVGSLVRTLMVERNTQVHSGGPTLEDIVRAELRPLLKDWLDTHLPPLVERLVRVEIERVVGRAVP